jgi:hypothetical protein
MQTFTVLVHPYLYLFSYQILVKQAIFKLFGGEAAKVFKCGLAKITIAAARLQSVWEY